MPDFSDLLTERRRAWLQRLRRDYENIAYCHRVSLTPPVLRVEPLTNKWGSWDAEVRTLTIAEKLITDYSWETVLEILKHEMAHQVVTDHFGSDQAHGPLFHRACDLLGVAEWARRAETELGNALETVKPLSADEERLLSRAEKLLALAESNNEHESFLAMQKVRELYAKYNLERLRGKAERPHTYFTIQLRRKRVERHQSAIASLLNDHFFVEVIHSSLFDSADCCEYKTLELLGTPQNVKLAEYVFYFMSNQLPLLWRSYQKEKRKNGRARMSFYLGVISGFREKLEKAEPVGGETATALVLLKDPQLEDFVRYRYPRLIKVRRGRRLHDSGSFEAGKAEGNRLVLKRGLHQNEGNLGKLLRGI
jgi:hypothetical protein